MGKRLTGLILVLAVFNTAGMLAQSTRAKIENVDFFVVDEKIMITYDIQKASRQEIFEISLECKVDDNRIIVPVSVEGDVGKNVKPGLQKTIHWSVFNDVDEIGGEISFDVTVVSVQRIYGGPGYAGLSVLVPGLGDYYVADPSKMAIKPYYRTIGAYGLVGYGIYERINANNKYDEYKSSTNQAEFDDLYNQANAANHRSYIAMGLGAVVWIYDIIWVIVKGSENKKNNQFIFQGNLDQKLMMGYDEHGIKLNYVIRF